MNNNNVSKKLFQCPECGLYYKDKEWVQKCEKFCHENNACNTEVIKHAVQVEK